MNTWEKLEAKLQAGRYTLVMVNLGETPDDDELIEDALEGLSAAELARIEATLDVAALPDNVDIVKLSVFDGVPAAYSFREAAMEAERPGPAADLLPEDCDGFEDGHFEGLPVGWWPLDMDGEG